VSASGFPLQANAYHDSGQNQQQMAQGKIEQASGSSSKQVSPPYRDKVDGKENSLVFKLPFCAF
jgi:beta-lactamase superfamily II metal-dependent hydrolase